MVISEWSPIRSVIIQVITKSFGFSTELIICKLATVERFGS